MAKNSSGRPIPRLPAGMADAFSGALVARQQMIETICDVYARYGFAPLETPAVEYLDALGKFLPEKDEPQGGVFAFKDDDGQWLSLRYDLTAPLSRVAAQYGSELPNPFRRYQVGPVWRREKPGPSRFRQFYQCDFDTVGTSSKAADAEVCAVLASAIEALGITRSEYQIRVNNRQLLNGVIEKIGLEIDAKRGPVLRAIDKLDRLGYEGVRALLGEGRIDDSGAETPGAGLTDAQAQVVLDFVNCGGEGISRKEVCRRMRSLVGETSSGALGVGELEQIDELLDAMELDSNVVRFDPTVIRGLEYYTGPVFEAVLTFPIVDDDGVTRSVGSVAGGGRYDDLVRRFTGTDVPATGASIGVDRLLTALRKSGRIGTSSLAGPVVVTVMNQARLKEYQQIVTELRSAGVSAELYLGQGNFRSQLKYADKRKSPVAVIVGDDEFLRGEISLKDLRLGSDISNQIHDRDEWRKGQLAQKSVPRASLIASVREILGR